MKKLNRLFASVLFGMSLLFINGCDPFDDLYVKMAMGTEFNTPTPVPNISLTQEMCLSSFDDYNDNVDNLNEIKYITAAYFTLDSSNGLQGDFRLRSYRTDNNALLFDYSFQSFNADIFLDSVLTINLKQEEINNINEYLTNPKVDKCFRTILDVNNASDNDGAPFQLHGKFEFLTELQVEP
mgnify:FL=1